MKIVNKGLSRIAAISTLGLCGAAGTANAVVISDTAVDGAQYTLNISNVGSLYSFLFSADFSGAGGSPVIGDYIQAISFASLPGSVDWSVGSVTSAPYAPIGDWGLFQGVVANSNGCPVPGAVGKDWCIGLDTTIPIMNDLLANQKTVGTTNTATTTNSLSWAWTMNLVSGTPVFDGWSYKVVSTTGLLQTSEQTGNYVWQYGGYQISETLGTPPPPPPPPPPTTVPEPTTLTLLGLGLLGLGSMRRRRA